MSLESVNDIQSSHRPTSCVLSVDHCIPENVLEEHLEVRSCLLVDQPRETLDSTSTGQSPDGWLRDTHDVVFEDLPVTDGSTLAKTFALAKTFTPFATTRHLWFLSGLSGLGGLLGLGEDWVDSESFRFCSITERNGTEPNPDKS